MGNILNKLRKRVYNTVTPRGYNIFNSAKNILFNSEFDYDKVEDIHQLRDDIWATYLQIPESERHNIPEKATIYQSRVNNDHPEYGINVSKNSLSGITENDWNRIITESFQEGYSSAPLKGKPKKFSSLNFGESKPSYVLSRFLGTHAIGKGMDSKNGEYVSYGDLWDLAPFSKGSGNKDETLGFGKPVHIYDRMYLDDWYNVPENKRRPEKGTYYGGYLPEVEIYSKKSGGSLNYLNYINNVGRTI